MALPALKGGGVYGFWGVGSAGAPQVSVVVAAGVGLLGGAESWREVADTGVHTAPKSSTEIPV